MKARKVTGLDSAAPLAGNAARIVAVRLDELRELATPALHPGRATAQHDLRIAAKRLRYVLEATGFCFGDPADSARRAAKELQQVLGDLHDCDVMLPRVAEHIERLRTADAAAIRRRCATADAPSAELAAQAPNRAAYPGLEALAAHLQARRSLLFDRFVERWSAFEADGIWDRLAEAASLTPCELGEASAALRGSPSG